MLVQQCEDVIDDLVFGFGEHVRSGGLRDAGTGILAAKLGDDVVEVLFRAESLSLEDFDISFDLPNVGNGGFFKGHGLAFWAVVACHTRHD